MMTTHMQNKMMILSSLAAYHYSLFFEIPDIYLLTIAWMMKYLGIVQSAHHNYLESQEPSLDILFCLNQQPKLSEILNLQS